MSNYDTDNIVPHAPHFGAWSDRWVPGCIPSPPATKLKGLNFFNLCFWLAGQDGPWDQAKNWQDLPQVKQDEFKKKLAALPEAVSLFVTAFGSTDAPTTTGIDPIELADKIAAFVTDNRLDGVDVNYEDFVAFDKGTAEEWLIKFTKELRAKLPKGTYTITHSPIAPWFRTDGFYTGGGYMKIHQEVGNIIDWYNVQFFNQKHEYETIDSLLYKSSGTFPDTALFQIAKNGVPLSKLVIGKPASPQDAPSGGYTKPEVLAKALKEAKDKGWNGGAVVWQDPSAGNVDVSQWIKIVRSLSWPVPGHSKRAVE